MSNGLFKIKGKVKGALPVQRALHAAPDTFRKSILGWLLAERRAFVGGRTRGGSIRDGVFRKKLQRKKTLKGTSGWAPKVTRGAFKGYVAGGGDINKMRLTMGSDLKDRKTPFLEGIKNMGSGASIRTSKQMVLPVYKNLPNKKQTYKQFRSLMSAGRLYPVQQGAKTLYFDTFGDESTAQGDTLKFVGVRQINVGKQFDFEGDWNKRIPKVILRGQKKVDRTVDRIDRQMDF